jgi:hypothetical protein
VALAGLPTGGFPGTPGTAGFFGTLLSFGVDMSSLVVTAAAPNGA